MAHNNQQHTTRSHSSSRSTPGDSLNSNTQPLNIPTESTNSTSPPRSRIEETPSDISLAPLSSPVSVVDDQPPFLLPEVSNPQPSTSQSTDTLEEPVDLSITDSNPKSKERRRTAPTSTDRVTRRKRALYGKDFVVQNPTNPDSSEP